MRVRVRVRVRRVHGMIGMTSDTPHCHIWETPLSTDRSAPQWAEQPIHDPLGHRDLVAQPVQA